MKQKFPRADAIAVARKICKVLQPACSRLIVAGSLRRRRPEVGDVEILYIPRVETIKKDELFAKPENLADLAIEQLERSFLLKRRLNAIGSETFGEKNKLMVHGLTGIPVDLFEATKENWWNYLVCRTGPAESNVRIASRAQERGYQWKPYSVGFVHRVDGVTIPMTSERQVFEFLDLPYKEPWER